MSDTEKILLLTPSWKNYFWSYFLGLLLSPFLVGIVIIWFTNKTRKKIQYQIKDASIALIEEAAKRELDLVNILETSFSQTITQKLFGIGNIKFQASVSELVLEGISQPASLLEKIDTAIFYQKNQLYKSQEIQPREATHDPRTLDKLDYLTGLWQQGLISDEDYDEERKKFE